MDEKCIVCGGDLMTNGYCADFTCRGYVVPGELISCPQCKEKDKALSDANKEIEIERAEVVRLRGLIARMYNEFIRAAENTSPAVSENNWKQFQKQNNL